MSAAHDNASKKLEELRQDAREARQSEMTAELLDLVTGAEASSEVEHRQHGNTGLLFASTSSEIGNDR